MKNVSSTRLRRVAWLLTTVCSSTLLLAAGPAGLDEAQIFERLLKHDVVTMRARAARVEARAVLTLPPTFAAPRFALRREQGFGGDASFTTTVLGLEADLDLSDRQQRVRSAGTRAVEASRQSETVRLIDAACALRHRALDVVAAQTRAAMLEASHSELVGLAQEVEQLVAGREKAPFDAERAALRIARHQRVVVGAKAHLRAARAGLMAWIGGFDGGIAADPAATPRTAGWLDRAVAESPRLATFRAQMRQARAEGTLGERWWVPGLGVQAGWRVDAPAEGDAAHGYEAGLTIELPFEDRGAPTRARAEADHARLAAELTQAESGLRAHLAAWAAELDALSNHPDADQPTAKLAIRARRRYRSGVAPLAELFDTLDALEAEAIARAERVARIRSLRLTMACAIGRFPEPELQRLIEESAP